MSDPKSRKPRHRKQRAQYLRQLGAEAGLTTIEPYALAMELCRMRRIDIALQPFERTSEHFTRLAILLGFGDEKYQRSAMKDHRRALANRAEIHAGLATPIRTAPERKQLAPGEPAVQEFYKSWEWKALRYDVLQQHERRCMCCGAGPSSGIRIVVDHIKPVRWYWHLRLHPDNLQVLCDDCNMGKGSRDETDFRPVA
jgi:hypothetical protein